MPKRILQGVVVSDKQDKTVVVKVERRFTHPLLKKTVRRTKNYHAHDEANKYKVGDTVRIEDRSWGPRMRPFRLLRRAKTGDVDPRQAKSGSHSSAGNRSETQKGSRP